MSARYLSIRKHYLAGHVLILPAFCYLRIGRNAIWDCLDLKEKMELQWKDNVVGSKESV